MKILLIDDSPDFRALVRVYLSKELPQAELEQYEVEKLGRPPDNFDWSRFDVLLLDYQLGDAGDGLEWLKTFGRRPGFPPTVILTAEGDEYVAVKAVKLGAADYVNKKDISPKRLKALVEDALAQLEEGEERKAAEKENMQEATQIIRKIHKEKDALPETRGMDIGYRFVRLIGQGAMSHVYLAERESDNLSVVLKVLDLTQVGSPALVKRFIQEAELIAGLHSPFVVRIYEHGMTSEYGFIAMEFFPRGDLKQRMESPLRPDVAINYMSHVAYGLEAIHGIGVVHRDLKPANIMFRGDDSLALADFGISKRLEGGNDLTTIGQVLGTPHYMSPEQGEGKAVDYRTDLYSAGIMFYEMLTGEKPYTAQTPAALIYQHVHAEIPILPSHLRGYQGIIERTLAKDPDDRYQNAREFIEVLEAAEREFS